MEGEDKCARVSKTCLPQDIPGGLLPVLDKSLRTSKDRRVGASHVHIYVPCVNMEFSPLSALCLTTQPPQVPS